MKDELRIKKGEEKIRCGRLNRHRPREICSPSGELRQNLITAVSDHDYNIKIDNLVRTFEHEWYVGPKKRSRKSPAFQSVGPGG
jgi:hypothetical protein